MIAGSTAITAVFLGLLGIAGGIQGGVCFLLFIVALELVFITLALLVVLGVQLVVGENIQCRIECSGVLIITL